MEKILGITISLLLLLSYFIYLKQIIQKKSIPNPTTWIIWSTILTINTVMHFSGIEHSIYQTLIAFATFSAVFIIMFYSFFACSFPKLILIDKIILVISLTAVVFYFLVKDANLSALFLQTAIFLSFIPTIVGLIKDRLKEAPTPWILALLTYIIQATFLIINYDYSIYNFPLLILINLLGTSLIIIIIITKKYGE